MLGTQRRLVLASSSPRRRDLLTEAGFAFEVVSADVEELACDALTGRELTLCNALRKATAVADHHAAAVVLAADTVVVMNGEVIGKPANMEHAREILRRLGGRTHEVYSSVVVSHRASFSERLFTDISIVTFRRLNDAAITAYFAKINPLDKAGAYAAQGHGTDIIEKIDGSYTNVVGLPMEKTIAVLREFGVEPKR